MTLSNQEILHKSRFFTEANDVSAIDAEISARTEAIAAESSVS